MRPATGTCGPAPGRAGGDRNPTVRPVGDGATGGDGAPARTYRTRTSRIRSSPLPGVPRPSVSLVVSQIRSPPAGATVRSRP